MENPKPIQLGIKVVVGEMAAPPLPDGFRLTRHLGLAIVRSPAKKAFIIALNPPRLVPIRHRESGHTLRCDFDNPIPLGS